jgi:regulatory protein YycI of two-component signal transduction system YycFG
MSNIEEEKKLAAEAKAKAEKEAAEAKAKAKAKAEKEAADKAAAEVTDDQDITVEDPSVILPKELPLIVKPGKDGWANEAQEAFARVLNGYAYKNPEKWESKKDILIAQLKDLKANPKKLGIYQGSQVEGVQGSVTFKSQSAPSNIEQK